MEVETYIDDPIKPRNNAPMLALKLGFGVEREDVVSISR